MKTQEITYEITYRTCAEFNQKVTALKELHPRAVLDESVIRREQTRAMKMDNDPNALGQTVTGETVTIKLPLAFQRESNAEADQSANRD